MAAAEERSYSLPGIASHLKGVVSFPGFDDRPATSKRMVEVVGVNEATTEDGIRAFFNGLEVTSVARSKTEDNINSYIVTFVQEGDVEQALLETGQILDERVVSVRKPVRKTTWAQGRAPSMAFAIFNLVNAILGSGILALPYVMRGSGIVLFSIILCIMIVIVEYSLQLLISAALTTRIRGEMVSYERLGSLAWGEKGRLLISFMIILQNSGAICSYFRVFEDVIGTLMALVVDPDDHPDSLLLNSRFMTFMVACLVFFPSCTREIGVLGQLGVVALALIFFFVGFVIQRYASLPYEETCAAAAPVAIGHLLGNSTSLPATCDLQYVHPTLDTFLALPTFCFAFVCHTSVLPVFHELTQADDIARTARKSHKRMMVAIRWALLIAFSAYMLASIFGYLTFRDMTNSDLLINYGQVTSDEHDGVSIFVRISFMFAVCMTIPLLVFPYRRAVENFIAGVHKLRTGVEPEPPTGKWFWIRHVTMTFLIIFILLTLALFVDSISVIFAAVGSTSSVSLVFILPSALFIKLCLSEENHERMRARGSLLSKEYMRARDDVEGQEEIDQPTCMARFGPKAILLIGCTIFVVSWAGLIYKWSGGGS
eukprot:TRINITY_DN1087_c0_g5_i1.p1 TRINITY_DN1087_c0_g5~~TRINITY_DN1087_c0_g5_i1.p1  ORF type:complete len:626 (+),score=234.43 TRINITY_DN1087_c0_g5_i1:83-1879(+)